MPAEGDLPHKLIAGAWVRSPMPMPCVQAAALTAREAADLLTSRVRGATRSWDVDRAYTMPRTNPVVTTPPYRFEGATLRMFLVDVDPARIEAELPPALAQAPGLVGKR